MKPFQSTPERRVYSVWHGMGYAIIEATTAGVVTISRFGANLATICPGCNPDTAAVRIAKHIKANSGELQVLTPMEWEYIARGVATSEPAPPVVGVPLGMEQGRLI
jgi:hypothetical protein